MRIFALETNANVIKRRFIVEGEDELVTTAHHWVVFFAHSLLSYIVMAVLAAIGYAVMLSGVLPPDIALWLLVLWYVILFFITVNAFIQWKCNLLIVTTHKIIEVHQRSFFYAKITPTSLDNISSAHSESQFWGLFRVGKVYISLKQRLQGSSQEIVMNYMPAPSEIVSIIENALSLARQQGQQVVEKEEVPQQVQSIKEKSTFTTEPS